MLPRDQAIQLSTYKPLPAQTRDYLTPEGFNKKSSLPFQPKGQLSLTSWSVLAV